MQLPRPRTALRAVLPGLVSAVALGMLPAPSYAAPANPTTAGPTTTARATGLPKLEDDAVDALRRVTTAQTRYDKAIVVRDQRIERVQLLGDQAAEASERARRLHAQVDDSRTGLLLDAVTSFVTGDDTQLDQAVVAIEDEKFALGLLATAEDALLQANLDVKAAEKELARARAKAAEVKTRTAAMRAARRAIEQSQPGRDYAPTDRGQRRLDEQALAAWEDYLVDVARAGIVPPDAEALADPKNLVEPFEPAHDRRGRALPGVAEVETEDGTLTVLSAESVRAVAAAFYGLGDADAPDVMGGRAYTCGGLAGTAWGPTELGVPAAADSQWDTLGAVPTGAVDRGDLVFTAAQGDTPSSVGIVVGDGLVVAADPETGAAAVQKLDAGATKALIGARRPSLAAGNGLRLPQTATPQCEEPAPPAPAPVPAPAAVPPASTTGGWNLPVPTGYTPTTAFGVAGPLWSSGRHTGLDFAAPAGTPAFAARAGVVTVERPAWAGLLVRIDHGDGVETWYAHLSAADVVPGQIVEAGEPIGAVGSAGNSTGPHLHFEVRLDGTAVDPAATLGLT